MVEIQEILARANAAGENAYQQTLKAVSDTPIGREKAETSRQTARAEYLVAALETQIRNSSRAEMLRQPRPAPEYFGQPLHCCPACLDGKNIHCEYVTWVDDGDRYADVPAIWIDGTRILTAGLPARSGSGDRFTEAQLDEWRAVALDDYRKHHDPFLVFVQPARSAVRSIAAYAHARRLAA